MQIVSFRPNKRADVGDGRLFFVEYSIVSSQPNEPAHVNCQQRKSVGIVYPVLKAGKNTGADP